MKYAFDHDYHIHSQLSECSSDPEQTTERILAYAKENGLTNICLTDHFWDEKVAGASRWYAPQNFEHVKKALPLPQADGVKFYFGVETEMREDYTLGISKERFDEFDFVIIPTTHLHMDGFTISREATDLQRAEAYVKRWDALLEMDLPFRKIGLAHPLCSLINARGDWMKTMTAVGEKELLRLLSATARKGMGVEINMDDVNVEGERLDFTLRFYALAKECGCKFYLGSDAHNPKGLISAPDIFARTIDLIGLTEDDKFHFSNEG